MERLTQQQLKRSIKYFLLNEQGLHNETEAEKESQKLAVEYFSQIKDKKSQQKIIWHSRKEI